MVCAEERIRPGSGLPTMLLGFGFLATTKLASAVAAGNGQNFGAPIRRRFAKTYVG